MTPISTPQAAPTPCALTLATKIVSSYLQQNKMPQEEVTGFITTVHGQLLALMKATGERLTTQEMPNVYEEYIVSFENGKRYKSLKRHLNSLNISPEDYRNRHKLPRDYPMVAPAFSKRRSDIARTIHKQENSGRFVSLGG